MYKAFFIIALVLHEDALEAAITPLYGYKIIREYPHDRTIFTQGLVFDQGIIYESSGLYKKSLIRSININTGAILNNRAVGESFFAEGMTIFQDKIILLTWKEKTAIIYDKKFNIIKYLNYPPLLREGWGITHDGSDLIISDGSHIIYFLDANTFEIKKSISVFDNNNKLYNINELEYIEGEIYANIWMTDRIARISPTTGKVLGFIDLFGLGLAKSLNGIAYDAVHKRLFVTGKLWPKIFEIKVMN
jgi:glutamine cyclotransferase